VAWKGAKPGRRSIDPAKTDDLLAALKDDNQFWRLTAQRLLVERAKKDVVPQLFTMAKDQSVDAIGLNGGVVHALWTLHGLGALDGSDQASLDVAIAALKHPSLGVRRNAVQVLPPIAASSAAVVASGILSDKELNVRLAAFLAVSTLPASDELGAALFAQSQVPAVLADRYLPLALQVGAAQHGAGYLAAGIKAGIKVPLPDADKTSAAGLIANSGFEAMTGDLPSGWVKATYTGKGEFTRVDGGRTGFCVQITSTEGADIGWMTTIPVKPRTKYRATAWIKTKDLKGATGALLNLNGHPAKSKAVTGTKDWTKVTMDFDSENRTSVEMNCLYGGWGQSTGTAWWDDVTVVELGQGGSLPGQVERLVARNFAIRGDVDHQLAFMQQATGADAGFSTTVFAGLAEGWNDRDVPKDLTAKQRSDLAALATKAAPQAQASIGAIAARWSAGGAAIVKAATTGPKLPADELKRFESGRNRYMTLCIACHQANGQGLPGLAPSLVKSEWVQGPASRPVRIVLHGLQGPITVNGALFNSPLMMPPQKDVLDDVAIAEVLTYVRNEWGNQATPVQAAEVKVIRDADAARTQPWTAEELMKLK
jgi:mono/diheme cytochrome c family protein